ncbi:hypothetical protein BaRGS_00015567, partial [Batillaria attramentaria]
QNAQTFREKTGAFRKLIKKHAELVFITAPNRVPSTEPEESTDGGSGDDQMGWWFSRQDDYFHAQDQTNCHKGYEESLQLIQNTISEQASLDRIVEKKKWFDFAILVAGFKSRSSGHDHLYSKRISIPTLHVFGDTDKVIPKEMSQDLLQYFQDCVTLEHPGGHFIPAGSAQKKVYLEFLDKMKEKKKLS